MKKYEVLDLIQKEKIIAIVRTASEREALDGTAALTEGGLSCVELTFTAPFSHRIFERLAAKYDKQICLGAGTVLDAETARIAILSGARYLITPALNTEVIRLANRYGVPVIPGIATATEALTALEAGAEAVKLFPARQFDSKIIKDLKAPLPDLELVPTGGISVRNIKEWIDAGAFACGVGGSLLDGLKEGNYKKVEENAKLLKEALR